MASSKDVLSPTTPHSPSRPELFKKLEARVSRRSVLRGAAGASALAVSALWSREALAQGQIGASRRRDPVLMLVNRLTYGQNEAELALARSKGYWTYLQEALYPPAPIDDSAMESFIAPASPYVDSIPADYPPHGTLGLGASRIVLGQTLLNREILTKRQAYEKIVECWLDHFNKSITKDGVDVSLARSNREVLRPHADGHFETLLEATMQDPSMLIYLDNHLNRAPKVNENYARELLELHTLSPVDRSGGAPGYDENDVRSLAEILSGWSVNTNYDASNPASFGSFLYVSNFHVTGDKPFLNGTILNGGQSEGAAAARAMVDHQSTAYFVAYKLARYFLSYDPPQGVLDAAAQQFMSTTPRGDIRAMIGIILQRNNIIDLASPGGGGLKLRRPKDFLVALARATSPSMDPNLYGLHSVARKMGNEAYGWGEPDGYPDQEESWVGAIFGRWEAAFSFFADPTTSQEGIEGISFSDAELQGLIGSQSTLADVAERINVILTGGVMTNYEVGVLEAFMQSASQVVSNPLQVVRDGLALGACTPTFQYF